MYDNAFRFRDSTVSVVWVVLCRFWQSLRDCTTSSTFNSFGTHTLRFVRSCEDWNPVAWKFNELLEFRSRLCRRRLSQSNTRWTTLDEIYQISILLESSNRKKFNNIPIFKTCFQENIHMLQMFAIFVPLFDTLNYILRKIYCSDFLGNAEIPDFQNFSMTIHSW